MSKKLRKRSVSYDYFFIRPAERKDAHRAARKLMGIEKVKEVAITEGRYGFVIKADLTHGNPEESIGKEIIKVAGGSVERATCHGSYRKR